MPPNILFIFTDQQTLRAMGICGNPHLSTPHMDAIAAGGIRFDCSYCPAPVCGPSRAAMMTGLMPHLAGVDINDVPFDPSIRTLGHVFGDAGYDSAYSGKWHLPEHYHFGDTPETAHGFRFLRFPQPANHHAGAAADPLATDQAVTFLRQKHDRPFLLVVSLHNPHDICGSIRRITPRSAADGPDLPLNFPRDPDEPQFITDCRQRRHYGNEQNATWRWGLDHWRGYLHHYYRLVEHADANVGRIMAALREQGLERDTLVVFTSDHGEGVAAHQWVVKLMLYEEPVTVPLALRWPGVIPEGVTDRTHLASGVDLLPTLCDYTGVPIPDRLSGVSLKPVIEQPQLEGRPFVVAELQPDTKDPSKLARMIRTRQHKYVAFSYGRNPEMLFDLDNDPGEVCNLAHLPDAAATLAEHRELLTRWCRETDDRFVVPGRDTTHTRG